MWTTSFTCKICNLSWIDQEKSVFVLFCDNWTTCNCVVSLFYFSTPGCLWTDIKDDRSHIRNRETKMFTISRRNTISGYGIISKIICFSILDLKTMGVRNWRRKSQDRDQWRAIVKRPRFILDRSARKRRRQRIFNV
jgi:hypothetical protein